MLYPVMAAAAGEARALPGMPGSAASVPYPPGPSNAFFCIILSQILLIYKRKPRFERKTIEKNRPEDGHPRLSFSEKRCKMKKTTRFAAPNHPYGEGSE
jgi:hypothetical protein